MIKNSCLKLLFGIAAFGLLLSQQAYSVDSSDDTTLKCLPNPSCTRYEFNKLQEITNEICERGLQDSNKIKGLGLYPILHTVLIEIRDSKGEDRGKFVTLFKQVLDTGPDLNAFDKHGYTLLTRSAEENNEEIFKLLLEDKGANPNFENNPLHLQGKYDEESSSTSFEHVLRHSPSNVGILQKLFEETQTNEKVKRRLGLIYDEAKKENDDECLKRFLDLRIGTSNLKKFLGIED